MASSKDYLTFVLDQLSGLNGIAYRAMMGEYVLYFGDKVAGGIFDDRLLVKPVPAALALMPDAPRELPYPGAKEMLLVEDVDDAEFLRELFRAMYDELPTRPAPKTRKAAMPVSRKTGRKSGIMKTASAVLCLLAVLLLGACSAEPGTAHEYDETKYFQKVTANMTLEHGYLRYDYTLGTPNQVMTFLLRNMDVTPVSVNEWLMNEPDNIRLYYAFCEPGKSGEIEDDAWQLAWPDVEASDALRRKTHPRRSALVLQPNNSAVLDVPLTFLEHARPPRRQARYTIALYAQIALNTLQTRSEVFEITVYPKTKDVEIE